MSHEVLRRNNENTPHKFEPNNEQRLYHYTSLNKTLTMAPEALTMAYIYEARKPREP
jgi:hypothetical protein